MSYIKRCSVCGTNLLAGTDALRPYETYKGAYYCMDHIPGNPTPNKESQKLTGRDEYGTFARTQFPTPPTLGKITAKLCVGGEGAGVTVNRLVSDLTFMTDLEKRGLINVSRAIDVLLASNEAERQVNEWLDVLRDPKAPDERKKNILGLLQDALDEYAWLCRQRNSLSHVFSNN